MFVEDEYKSDMFFKLTKCLRYLGGIKFTDQNRQDRIHIIQGSVISAFISEVSLGSGHRTVTEYGHIWSQSPRTEQESILPKKNSEEITQGAFIENMNWTNYPHAAPSTCLIFSAFSVQYLKPSLLPSGVLFSCSHPSGSNTPQRSPSGIKPPAFFYTLLF